MSPSSRVPRRTPPATPDDAPCPVRSVDQREVHVWHAHLDDDWLHTWTAWSAPGVEHDARPEEVV